jgi:hypothetical protein
MVCRILKREVVQNKRIATSALLIRFQPRPVCFRLFPTLGACDSNHPVGARVIFGHPEDCHQAFMVDVFKSGQRQRRIARPRQRGGKISQSLVACSARLIAPRVRRNIARRFFIIFRASCTCAGLRFLPIACSRLRFSSFEIRCTPSVKPSLRFNSRLIDDGGSTKCSPNCLMASTPSGVLRDRQQLLEGTLENALRVDELANALLSAIRAGGSDRKTPPPMG